MQQCPCSLQCVVTQYLEAAALLLGQLEVLCTGDELTVVAAEGTGCELAGDQLLRRQ